ncbi:MAG: glycosyltransferase family 2 protein [Acidimicrobiales bacterium]
MSSSSDGLMSSSSSALVTVGMPLYNAERYLDEAVKSVLRQSFDGFQLVMSDNASTDGTLERCHYWAKRDARIVVLESESNRGAAWNYNRTVEAATGKYFRWQAHDDRCEPDMLRQLVECFARDPSIVLAFAFTRLIDADGNEIRQLNDKLGIDSDRAAERYRMMVRNLRDCNAVFGLIDRSVLLTTKMIGPYSSSDRALLYELALRGRFAEVPDHLFERRRHLNSSLRASKSRKDLATWFDTGARRGLAFPGLRLLRRHAQNLQSAPLTTRERSECAFVLATEWPIAYARATRQRWRREWRARRNQKVAL